VSADSIGKNGIPGCCVGARRETGIPASRNSRSVKGSSIAGWRMRRSCSASVLPSTYDAGEAVDVISSRSLCSGIRNKRGVASHQSLQIPSASVHDGDSPLVVAGARRDGLIDEIRTEFLQRSRARVRV
jgi:hypothetical protein